MEIIDAFNKNSILQNIPQNLSDEIMEEIVNSGNVRIEKIVSQGQVSAEDFWYDQDEHEWVIIVKGSAKLQFADKIIELQEGEYLNIPSHTKHRVIWTNPNCQTIWLAVFYK